MTSFEYSAGAFVYRMEKGTVLFLLLKKPNGAYDLPKGHIEKGETAEVAAKREIREESGLGVEFVPGFVATTKYFFRREEKMIVKQVKYFISEVADGGVTISHEHIGYEWQPHAQARKKLKFKNIVKILDRVAAYIDKYSSISDINRRYAAIPKRSGWELSTRFVPGEGSLDGQVMIIGQAPGAEEDKLGRPFVGRSGKLLDSVLRKTGMKRHDMYITNVVQFFPPGNRMPSQAEVKECLPFLMEQVKVIEPAGVILLGNLAAASLLGVEGSEKNHGSVVNSDGKVYMVTIHPSAVVRFKSKYDIMLSDFKKFKAVIDKGSRKHARH